MNPSYWPRGRTAVEESVELHSRIFRRFGSQNATTLFVVGFAMGNWIGGTYTYAALTALANMLHGLFRVRAFTQDDAHIFCRLDQVQDEVNAVLALTDRFYGRFGFEHVG